jgi:hypothetical protein
MNWNLEGLCVNGMYMGDIPVHGRVETSRVAYGGEVMHTLILNKPVMVYKNLRDRVMLSHKEVTQVFSSLNEFI